MQKIREQKGVQESSVDGYTCDTIIVVPTLYLQQQWAEDIKEWGFKSVQIWTIQSLVKRQDLKCRLLILDEIHMYASNIFGQVFNRVEYKWVYGLTATLPEDDVRRSIINRYAPVSDTVTLEECHRNGWVSEFVIYNLAIELNPEERELYDKLNKNFGRFFGVFGHDFNLAMGCLTKAETRHDYAQSIGWDEKKLFIMATNWRRNMDLRKKLLHNSVTKLETALEICHRFDKSRIITFSQTIDMADALNSELGKISEVYHSKVKGRKFGTKYFSKAKMLERAIDRFKDDTSGVRVLCTAKALDQGANIPQIDFAITISGTSKQRQALQRWGRAVRKVHGKSTRIVELYLKDTQDERWMKSRQKAAPDMLVRHITSIDQIL